MRNNTKKTTPEPLRAKWLARNKTIIIITEASDERIYGYTNRHILTAYTYNSTITPKKV